MLHTAGATLVCTTSSLSKCRCKELFDLFFVLNLQGVFVSGYGEVDSFRTLLPVATELVGQRPA